MGVLKRPAGADAARVLAVGIVGWYHIWQQSWVSPGPLEPLVRGGYVWVDMMILLSAFCLTLPYAFDWAEESPSGAARAFTGGGWCGSCRGITSAWGCTLRWPWPWAGPTGGWPGIWPPISPSPRPAFCRATGSPGWEAPSGPWGCWRGFICCSPCSSAPSGAAPGIAGGAGGGAGGLWTVCPGACGQRLSHGLQPAARLCGVLGLGMGGALLYAKAALVLAGRYRWLFAAGAALAAVAIFGLVKNSLLDAADNRRWQLEWRMPLAGLFLALLLCLCLCMGQSGGLLRWLAGASYGFYLWHQSVAVWLKQARIPFWEGDVPPTSGGTRFGWQNTTCCAGARPWLCRPRHGWPKRG